MERESYASRSVIASKAPRLPCLKRTGVTSLARFLPGPLSKSMAHLTDDKLVEVLWDGKQVMMFVQDLRSRAELTE